MQSIKTSKCIHICAHANTHIHTNTHMHTHPGTHTHEHSDYTKLNLHILKMGSKQRLELDEDSSTEQKTWQVYSFGKINVFR